MAITINGSANTVAGLSAGGLPDNTVDGGNLAMGSDAAGDILYYNGTDYIRLAKGTDGQVLKLAGGVPTWAADTAGGITVADQWRLTGNLNGGTSYTPTNWEQVDTDGFNNIGTAMSHSSGIFTFPSTGIYQITFYTWFYIDNAYENEVVAQIQTTTDNSSYDEAARGQGSIANNSANTNFFDSTSCTHLFDVTSTTNCKVKFYITCTKTSTYFNGDTNATRTNATFIRLGDT